MNCKTLFISVIFITIFNLSGFSQITPQWAINTVNSAIIGGDVEGNCIKVDTEGNIYITGYFEETADFDPSVDTVNLTSAGSEDIFIAKYDISGNYIWAKSIGGTSSDYGHSIAVDNSGNVYITGYFNDTVDFDPSGNVVNLISAGNNDIFIAKYDASGNYVYAKSMGGTILDEGNSIDVDASGNVYITGYFWGTADFDPSDNVVNLTSAGYRNIFIAKYDASGNYVYAKSIGGISDGFGRSIAVDNSGNVYITGYFSGTADFDPSTNVVNLTSIGNFDIFIAKYDASGNYVYAKRMGGTSDDIGRSIAVDNSGNVYITGVFSGTADFDPSENVANLTSAGYRDIFIAKYNDSGNYIYAKSMGGTNWDEGYSIDVDASGNVYITGYFGSTADFDPSANVVNLTSAGYSDIFIAKYDASGNYIYAKNMAGTSSDYGNSISVDVSGNVYITGEFKGTADFDPSVNTANLTSGSGIYNSFIAKYNSNGDYLFAGLIGVYPSENKVISQKIIYDNIGNVYITGYFEGTADFDPSANVVNLTSTSEDYYDIFIAKYDASGNYIYAKSMGGIGGDYGNSIAVDVSGNVYITGYFYGTADFDPSVNIVNLTSAGYEDIFIAKYDASGNYVYAKSMGGTSFDYGNSIAVDVSGNAYITGRFYGTSDFDPSVNVVNLTSAGYEDIFIAKYDASGNYVYAKSMGGTSDDYGSSITVDNSGNVYITGYFNDTVDFDPSSNVANLTSAGDYDIFIAKYDASGNYVYAKSMGGTSWDEGNSIDADASGNVYITGDFEYTADFDPSANVVNLTSAGSCDIFIAKYDASGNYIWAKSVGGTDYDLGNSIAFDISGNAYITGLFYGTADFDPSANIVNLTSTGNEDIFIAKYDASGNYIYAKSMGGTYTDYGYSVAVDVSDNVYITGYFKGSVDFNPSSDTLNLQSINTSAFIAKYSQDKEMIVKSNNIIIANGDNTPDIADNTNFDTIVVNTSVTEQFSIECTSGYLDLVLPDNPKVTVTGNGFSLTTDAPEIIHAGDFAIFEITFNPTSCGTFNGNISITNNDDDNNPYTFSISGIAKEYLSVSDINENEILIYPNPTSGKLTIKSEKLKVNSVAVTDITGKTIQTFSNFQIDISSYPKGMYFISIKTDTDIKTFKIVKE